MDALAFAYWLQGYVELHGGVPNGPQWNLIKEHLNLVFHKVTPELGELGQELLVEDSQQIVEKPQEVTRKESDDFAEAIRKAMEGVKEPSVPYNPFNPAPLSPMYPYPNYPWGDPNKLVITC